MGESSGWLFGPYAVSSFIEKELRMQLRMKRKRKGEREEKETPPAWEQTVNILFMHGVIAQGKRAPGGGGLLSNPGYTGRASTSSRASTAGMAPI